ncbi:type II secretion system protein M [Pseudomonas sp. PDM14]|uniref:type II secretion system protein GspM n=1 Tax=Pseudomonas sp. PDM14 TaxID=2769288 RepID=UPI0017846712|nr:type II secretion system protein GspM [Pseudomonas sp. PDM14]MBD9483635.1 type II secretion system protein M [Pseudomonas sp. PDM14]
MNKWLQRWQGLAPREQWLGYLVGLVMVGLIYVLLVSDPLAVRLSKQEADIKLAEARRLEAENGLAELQEKLRADPNVPYNTALLAADASREQLLGQIDHNTSELITPDKMRAVLEDLLKGHKGLHLVGLESFSEPVKLADAAAPAVAVEAAPPATPPAAAKTDAGVTLYKHGVRLQLEGGYFDLLRYLQAIQGTPWKLNWDSLDYQVGEAGPGRAQISLQLYTLSRQSGWVGV